MLRNKIHDTESTGPSVLFWNLIPRRKKSGLVPWKLPPATTLQKSAVVTSTARTASHYHGNAVLVTVQCESVGMY